VSDTRRGKQVGFYVLSEPTEFVKHYECAAWSCTVIVAPGRYPVWAEIENGKVKDYPGLMVTMPATVVEDYFQSLFGGNAIGKAYDRKQNAGKADTFSTSVYAHSAAEDILTKGEASRWQLDGFAAERIEFEYNGKPCVTHGIREVV